MSSITLYSFAASPYALKVRCCLLFKGLPFNTLYVNPIDFRGKLPVGKTIPVLSHGNESRNESTDIALWLDEISPTPPLLVPEDFRQKVMSANQWVSGRLIPAVFRSIVGHGYSLRKKVHRRWELSGLLDRTVPGGVTATFRIQHLIFLSKIPFIRKLLIQTNLEKTTPELKQELANEFESMIAQTGFLAGINVPTLADIAAYPQIVFPYFQDGERFFLPGKPVADWVVRMEDALPQLAKYLPEQARRL
jgi:glutathione S-transferase